MNKNFIKNPLLIVTTIVVASALVGAVVVFEYRQPNPSNLTANVSSGEVVQVGSPQELTAELVQSELQSSAVEPQIQEEEPKVLSKPAVVSKPKATSPSSNPIVKSINPDSSNVIVSPSSVEAGESVTVTVSVPGSGDLSRIWQMDVYLESPTGLNTVQGSIASIDGEGRRFGDIAIPLGVELGTWIVKTVETSDNIGGITSYHFGTDIFATFAVTAL